MEVLISLLRTEVKQELLGMALDKNVLQQMMMPEILRNQEKVYFVYTTTMNLFDKLKGEFNCSPFFCFDYKRSANLPCLFGKDYLCDKYLLR